MSDGGGAACSRNRSWAGPPLPSAAISCIAKIVANPASTVETAIQGASGLLVASSAVVPFTATSIGGEVESYHNLSISCSLGTIPIPPVLSWPFFLTGCGVGTEPSASGTTCSLCRNNFYSPGGAAPCRSCP